MMSLIKRTNRSNYPDPIGGLDPWDRLFERMLTPWRATGFARFDEDNGGSFSPPVDIIHGESEIVLKAELPGLKLEDVEVTVHDDKLTLEGTKSSETDEKEEEYRYVERRYGRFMRTFQLPAAVTASKVRAEFKDGVLSVHMPIAEEAKPRKIEVAAA